MQAKNMIAAKNYTRRRNRYVSTASNVGIVVVIAPRQQVYWLSPTFRFNCQKFPSQSLKNYIVAYCPPIFQMVIFTLGFPLK